MRNKFLCLTCVVVAVLGFSASSFATNWNGSTNDGLWKTGANWDGGVLPATGDNAYFYYHPGQSVTIDSGTAATCAQLDGLGWYGNTNQGVLTIQAGGSLTASAGIILGQGGPSKLIIDGGSAIVTGTGYFYVGHNNAGVLQMNSGSVSAYVVHVTAASGSGHIQLDGGTLTAGNTSGGGLNFNEYGTMDITGGKVVIPWMSLAWMQNTYQPLIDAGKITGYGNKANVLLGYEDGVGGIMYAVPEPVSMLLLGFGSLALIRRK